MATIQIDKEFPAEEPTPIETEAPTQEAVVEELIPTEEKPEPAVRLIYCVALTLTNDISRPWKPRKKHQLSNPNILKKISLAKKQSLKGKLSP